MHKYSPLLPPTYNRYEPKAVLGFSANYRAIQVSCGVQHTAVVGEDGVLWTFGAVAAKLSQGQDARDKLHSIHGCYDPQPVALGFAVQVKQVSCGWSHSGFVSEQGGLWTWGTGQFGRLGHGDARDRLSATFVDSLQQARISMVACGGQHTLALDHMGHVYSCGKGVSLGHPNSIDCHTPERVESLAAENLKGVYIDAGAGHSALLTDQGQVYTWGLNGTGQLGLGSRQDTPAPSLVNLFGLRVRRVALGAYHTLLVTCNGDLLSCGAGGPDPDPETVRDLVKNDGVATKLDGGERGRLCQVAKMESVEGGDDSSSEDGADDEANEILKIAENNGDRLLPRLVEGPWRAKLYPKVAHVAAGGYHSMFVTEAGQLFTCGVAKYGRLGLGHLFPTYTPTHVTEFVKLKVSMPPLVASEPLNLTTDQVLLKNLSTRTLLSIAADQEMDLAAEDPAAEGDVAQIEGRVEALAI